MTIRSILGSAGLALLVGIAPASAGLINVSSYDIPNGNGVASSFFLNYWDGNYSAGTNQTTDNAPLTGGKGALTDGVIPTLRWDNPSVTPINFEGKGQYVGWHTPTLEGDPLMTFHFDGSQNVQRLDMWVDASNNGFVGAPISLSINNVLYVPTVSGNVDPLCSQDFQNQVNCALKLTVLGNWLGETITVQPHHGPLPWIFVSEVQFANAVPEPSTWAMMLLGFAGVAFVAYRRSRRSAEVAAA